jgi:hypothetical protein
LFRVIVAVTVITIASSFLSSLLWFVFGFPDVAILTLLALYRLLLLNDGGDHAVQT